ncbi:hypothetical protein FrEUN1fDRAFT_4636 [Parafrankia sp. EUN1f]|nr:hypothetical protein FrEUN1fDRAFT_4636 [Parafrankia sp. EUN1f]
MQHLHQPSTATTQRTTPGHDAHRVSTRGLRLRWPHWYGAIQGLYLDPGLFVDAENDPLLGRVEVDTGHVRTLSTNSGPPIASTSQPSAVGGRTPATCATPSTVTILTPSPSTGRPVDITVRREARGVIRQDPLSPPRAAVAAARPTPPSTRLVITRLRCDPRTRAYQQRRLTEGKTPREVRRLPEAIRRLRDLQRHPTRHSEQPAAQERQRPPFSFSNARPVFLRHQPQAALWMTVFAPSTSHSSRRTASAYPFPFSGLRQWCVWTASTPARWLGGVPRRDWVASPSRINAPIKIMAKGLVE